MLKQEGRHVFHRDVVYYRFGDLEIATPAPTPINVDGELIGTTPLAMRVLERALPLFVG